MSLVGEGAELSRPLGSAFVRAEPSLAGVGDYIELMKPRVMSLVVFTALVGLVLAPGHMHPVIAFTALLCPLRVKRGWMVSPCRRPFTSHSITVLSRLPLAASRALRSSACCS